MAYEGPVWYINAAEGFDGEDSGSELAPLASIAYAISRISSVGFVTTGHTVRVKRNGAVSYGTVNATSINPTPTNQFVLTVWDAENNGIPLINSISIISNMVVEGFRFIGASGAMVNVGASSVTIENVIIRTNIFNMTVASNHIKVGGASLTDIDNLNIIQNTLVDRTPQTNLGIGFEWAVSPNGITNSTISNNIFYRHDKGISSDTDITGMTNSDLTITHNNFYDLGTSAIENTPTEVNSVITDPQFIDYSSGNYDIESTSPCRDTGTNIKITNVDINGTLRPIYQTWDIGAYEIQGTFLSQLVGGNSFEKGSGVTKTSLVNPDNILALSVVLSDDTFNSEALWDRIIAVYKHSSGQQKIISHLLVGGTWQGQVSFSANANVGDWIKKEIILIDKDGDGLAIDRE